MSTEFYWIAVALVVIVASARITRLATFDHFPPVAWVRNKYLDRTEESEWSLLAICGYCFSFWATALVVGTGVLSGAIYTPRLYDPYSGWALAWWLIAGTFAASYVAAVFMKNDGDDA